MSSVAAAGTDLSLGLILGYTRGLGLEKASGGSAERLCCDDVRWGMSVLYCSTCICVVTRIKLYILNIRLGLVCPLNALS